MMPVSTLQMETMTSSTVFDRSKSHPISMMIEVADVIAGILSYPRLGPSYRTTVSRIWKSRTSDTDGKHGLFINQSSFFNHLTFD